MEHWLLEQCITLFRFTEADIKTALIPVTAFAAATAPVTSIRSLFETIFWIWLHLLQFAVSNQSLDPEEDRLNKPRRPLPAGRITMTQAIWLRWLLIPICLGYSALYSPSVTILSAGVIIMTIIYNEGGAHASHWTIRSGMNCVSYGILEAGATLVAGRNRDQLHNVGLLAVLFSIGALATTIHAQDFKDVKGDALIGRKTLPIAMPQFARLSMLAGLSGWSLALSYFWQLTPLMAASFCGLGLFIGTRFMTLKNARADQVSYYWYNIWLAVVHVLPGVWRFATSVM